MTPLNSIKVRAERPSRVMKWVGAALTAILLSAVSPPSAIADEVEDFYRGKTITLVSGFVAGGPAQASIDVFLRHLQKHIPGNPTIITDNMPGAGTLRAANYVFNAAPKDGTVIVLVSANALLAPLWQEEGAEFDPRTVGWLGSPTRRPTAIAFFRTDAPAQSFEQAREVELSVGSTGAGAATSVYARLLNAMAGTKFKLVLGYDGSPRVLLAIEQGEVDGQLGYSWGSLKSSQPHLIEDGIVQVLAQLSVVPDPELTEMGVPMVLDFVDEPDHKRILSLIFGLEEMQRPYAVPAGVPEERLAALRKALADTTSDPEYIAEVAAVQPDPIFLTSGEQMAAFIEDAYSLPEDQVQSTIALMRAE